MPLIFTKEEIKAYLAEKGFDVQDEEILDKLFHDLKKTVKYEDRRRRRERMGHAPEETNLDSTAGHSLADLDPQMSRTKSRLLVPESQNIHPSRGGHSSRVRSNHDSFRMIDEVDTHLKKTHRPKTARERSQKENIQHDRSGYGIRVEPSVDAAPSSEQIVMTRKTFKQQNGDPVVEESFVRIGQTSKPKKSRPKTSSGVPAELESKPKEVVSAYRYKNLSNDFKHRTKEHPKTDSSRTSDFPLYNEVPKYLKSTTDSQNLQMLASLLGECEETDDGETVSPSKTIKGPPDSVKRDPVALYHYYKGIWDKQNIPGESRHMQLRWNVRAQTVGNYPCVNGHPVKYLR